MLALVSFSLAGMAGEDEDLDVDVELLEFLGSFAGGEEEGDEEWFDPFWLHDAEPIETGGFDD